MYLNEAVAKRIKELCEERSMTQYALSMASGVPQSTLSTIMSCSYPSMKLRVIYEICEGFRDYFGRVFSFAFLSGKS